MVDKLSEAGCVVLPSGNAPQRYSFLAVYFIEGWQDKAEEIMQVVDIDKIDQVTTILQQSEELVVVLQVSDTASDVI